MKYLISRLSAGRERVPEKNCEQIKDAFAYPGPICVTRHLSYSERRALPGRREVSI